MRLMDSNEVLLTLEQVVLTKRVLIQPKFSVQDLAHRMCHEMEVALSGFLLGEQVTGTKISYPKDWWEHLKERWAPNWFVKRYPVVMSVHCLDFVVMYPDFHPKLPDERQILSENFSHYFNRFDKE